LLHGKSAEKEKKIQGLEENKANALCLSKFFSGNKPTNTILIDKLTPSSLSLFYTNTRFFVQGVIWNIF
jgi:glucose-6-phosphate isomerase